MVKIIKNACENIIQPSSEHCLSNIVDEQILSKSKSKSNLQMEDKKTGIEQTLHVKTVGFVT
jgi:hypothetical protein